MTTLSSHVLDVERGVPGQGVPIALYRADALLAEAETNADGRVANLGAGELDGGTYRLVFDVAAYFASQGRPAPFLRRVTIEFDIHEADPHYHVPLLLSPYACTSYRGS
ncbi:MAG TPA: hydroxyisourate hydrolase [Chloroflexota bacterium]|nr:hydroxyisourate hydrolase [Chloroflexota bacterium]